jgi:hypothetical protein
MARAKNLFFLAAFVFLLGGATSLPSDPDPVRGVTERACSDNRLGDEQIMGRVVDAETGETLPGAAITLRRAGRSVAAGTHTSPVGWYRLNGLSGGAWQVTVHMEGYAEAVYDATVAQGQCRQVSFALDEQRGNGSVDAWRR